MRELERKTLSLHDANDVITKALSSENHTERQEDKEVQDGMVLKCNFVVYTSTDASCAYHLSSSFPSSLSSPPSPPSLPPSLPPSQVVSSLAQMKIKELWPSSPERVSRNMPTFSEHTRVSCDMCSLQASHLDSIWSSPELPPVSRKVRNSITLSPHPLTLSPLHTPTA